MYILPRDLHLEDVSIVALCKVPFSVNLRDLVVLAVKFPNACTSLRVQGVVSTFLASLVGSSFNLGDMMEMRREVSFVLLSDSIDKLHSGSNSP